MRSKKESSRNHSPALACLLGLVFAVNAQAQTGRGLPRGITFEVVSVRVLSDEESRRRAPDVIGPDIAVRLRLSNRDAAGIYFCAWPNQINPLGYRVKQTNDGLVWLWGKAGEQSKSPGPKELAFGSATSWVLLLPFSAVEWEELDSTWRHGEKHAFTFFMKEDETSQPKEIVSDFFAVPAAAR